MCAFHLDFGCCKIKARRGRKRHRDPARPFAGMPCAEQAAGQLFGHQMHLREKLNAERACSSVYISRRLRVENQSWSHARRKIFDKGRVVDRKETAGGI